MPAHKRTEPWFSPRETQVLALLADGYTKREVGETLHMSENTVKTHLRRMSDRWSARNTIHLVVIAIREGALAP